MYLPYTPCLVFVWISSPSNSATLHICLLAPKELLLYSHDSSRVYLPPSIYTQSTYHIYISTYMYINILSSLCMHSTNMLWPRFTWISSMSATLNITHGTHIVFSVALSSGFSDGVILPTSIYALCYTISWSRQESLGRVYQTIHCHPPYTPVAAFHTLAY